MTGCHTTAQHSMIVFAASFIQKTSLAGLLCTSSVWQCHLLSFHHYLMWLISAQFHSYKTLVAFAIDFSARHFSMFFHF